MTEAEEQEYEQALKDKGFVRLPNGTLWIPQPSQERAEELEAFWLRPQGHSQDSGQRNPTSRSMDEGIINQT